jgi:NAD(P)-dependent dehydrogenase (short-subunit alcohol dehydrogenase family)
MNEMHSDLTDRVVVVTGAARGIGRAYVEAFLERGAKVVATDLSWDNTASFDTRHEPNLLATTMDVTNDAQIDATFAATIDRFGTADVVINNAAMRQRDLFPPQGKITTLETKDSDWQKSFNVNVFGVLKVIRRFIRPMIDKKRGSIINTVSSGVIMLAKDGGYVALRPGSREMPYMSSKAALVTLSFYLADEMKENNIAVNVVIPGHTRTTGFDEQNRQRLAMGMKQGAQPVSPGHMVPIALYLAGQDGSGTTGKMFDALDWNKEHGFGGKDAWLDKSFSYESLKIG